MNKTLIKTLCTRCQEPMTCEWPEEMNWAGEVVTAHQYMANALNSRDVMITCDACLDNMPDVDFSKMEVEYI
jgi:hypothetical protein